MPQLQLDRRQARRRGGPDLEEPPLPARRPERHPYRTVPAVSRRAGRADDHAHATRAVSVHDLWEWIGQQPTDVLARILGGLRVTIPTLAAVRRTERDRRIRALLDGGATLEEAARQEGVSRRTVARAGKKV